MLYVSLASAHALTGCRAARVLVVAVVNPRRCPWLAETF